jgi:hypothetical protein
MIPVTTPMATFVDVAIDEVVVVALLYERISTVAYIKRKKSYAAVSTVGIEFILTLTFPWRNALPAFRVTLFCVFNAFFA